MNENRNKGCKNVLVFEITFPKDIHDSKYKWGMYGMELMIKLFKIAEVIEPLFGLRTNTSQYWK